MSETSGSKALSVSIVIPVFNSEKILPLLMDRIATMFAAHDLRWEVILVNDGSGDKSWDVICELVKRHPSARGLNLMRNYGQHNAVLCGIRAARYDVIVTMDDDLQHPPEEIPKLLAKLREGNDVVYGKLSGGQHGLWRRVASQITKLALRSAMGVDVAREVSAFRAFRTGVRDSFGSYQGSFVSIDVLLTWGVRSISAVPVAHHPRHWGRSNYTAGKLIAHALNMMTGFSIVPLQLASLTGFVFTLFGFLVLVYVVGRYLVQGTSVPGFAFLASIVAIFSGAQLFALGIIGEYLARMHFRTMGKPPYVVREHFEVARETDPGGNGGAQV